MSLPDRPSLKLERDGNGMSMRNHILALSLAPLGLVAPSCDPPNGGDGDTETSTGHDGST